MVESSQLVKLVSLMIISLLMNSPHGEAITCEEVDGDLYPCLIYIIGGGMVPSGCCDGLKSVVNEANTQTDRQKVCSCLKDVASSATDDQIQRAAAIPGQCGVTINFNISRDVDCSKVN